MFFSAEQIQIIAVLPTIIGLIADFIVSLLFLAFYSILVFFLKKEKITQWIFVIILLIKSFFSYVNYRYALVNNDLIPFDFFWFYGKDIIADQTYLKGLVEDLLKQDVIFVVLIPLMFSIMFRQRIFFSINAPFKTKIFKQKSFF
ncbi:hypothetical protein KKA14_17695, partial [bacterium]|nr:hypothetical protein [bacterium]